MVMQWHSLTATVIGATHIQRRLPNQDAIAVFQEKSGMPLIMAVADGHGGAKYTHSDLGATFAVESAIHVLQETFKNETSFSLTQIKRMGEEIIPQKIVHCWQQKVDAYCQKHSELNDPYKYRYFGTTLLITLCLSQCILYWQIGDGEIVALWENNLVEKPIPTDSRLIGNETTSLCGKNPWRDFRFYFQPFVNQQFPQFILLSSDGYSQAFANNHGFEQAVMDIAEFLNEKGHDWVKQQLPIWLQEASEQGSGDDSSVGIIYYG